MCYNVLLNYALFVIIYLLLLKYLWSWLLRESILTDVLVHWEEYILEIELSSHFLKSRLFTSSCSEHL